MSSQLSRTKAILVGIMLVIWGLLALFALYFGFFMNNFEPFDKVIAGSGFFALIITLLLKEVSR